MRSIAALLLFCLATNAQEVCVQNSTMPTCASYIYPTDLARGDIDSLCTDMNFMPGCTLDRTCRDSSRSDISGSMFCRNFHILREICAYDTGMSMMRGCKNYTTMCTDGAMVQQCSMSVLPIPSTMVAKSQTLDICNEMTMDGCEKCSAKGTPCEWLAVYSDLCIQMPDMSQCASWKTMCAAIPDWPLCSVQADNPSSPVQMLMYFHTGFSDYILFKGWVPRNNWQYALSIIAVFIISVLYELLKLGRYALEKRWTYEYAAPGAKDCCDTEMAVTQGGNCDKKAAPTPFRPYVDFTRCALHGLEVAWSLFVMLIAMTFNVGLFIAIVAGAMTGMCMVGRFIPYNANSSCCH